MKFTDRIRAFLAPAPAVADTADEFAQGRPRAIEGESMVLGNELLASMTTVAQGGIYFMPADEIIRRKGWAIYKEMLNDDQVKSCLAFKKILVAGRAFEIAPADESAEAKKQAEFVEEALERVSINDVFTEALSALEFGFSFAEKVYARDTWDADGQQYVFLKKLAHRDPEQIYIQADVHGNVTGAQQYNTNARGTNNQINVTPDKFWLFTHNKRFGNNFGTSDLRSAYRPWWAKKFIINFWNVYLERMGSPMTVMKYPQGASDELKNTLKKIMRGLSSKTEILIPDGVEIDLVEATRGGSPNYETALAFHNASIARAILMVGLWGQDDKANQSQGNSQSFIHLRLLFKMADTISQQLAKSLMDQVVVPLLELNFPKVQKPKFIWQDYGQFEGQVVADEIRQLHAAGIIDMDQSDVNYVRSIMGLPLRDDDNTDEVIRPAPTPPPGGGATQPPAAPQGNDRAGKGGAKQADGANQGKQKTEASEDSTYALVLKKVEVE